MPEIAHRVVIVGGGFGGLRASQRLGRSGVPVTLVDRRNFHLFQPLLYQVATGSLSPANIAAPLRALLKRQRRTQVLLGEVVEVDVERRQVGLADGAVLAYDSLIVATGASHHYFGNDWSHVAPGLKTIEDAAEIRSRVLLSFERAERADDPADVAAWLTFVIVGAGPTGVELAGTLCELARHTLRQDFRKIDPSQARVLLVEGSGRVLPAYPSDLSARAEASLRALGTDVRLDTVVSGMTPGRVTTKKGDVVEVIATHNVLWAAGVVGSPLGAVVARAAGADLDRAGRVVVRPDCSLAGHPEIFVIGDLASFAVGEGRTLPGVAQVAIQQGVYVARVIEGRLRARPMTESFHYRDLGNMATIGRHAAVCDFGTVRFGGYLAWLTWVFVHVINLVHFENRVLVLVQWAWAYITFNRSARLITDAPRLAELAADRPK